MSADFAFDSRWHLPHPPRAVAEVLVDLEHYPSWWAQVRAVARVDDDTARVLCRSVLPYTLDLVLHAERRELPQLRTRVVGDLRGFVAFHLAPQDGGTALRLEQRVRVAHPLLARVAGMGAPLMRWNHDLMMAGCLDGLRRRLRAQESAARALS